MSQFGISLSHWGYVKMDKKCPWKTVVNQELTRILVRMAYLYIYH